MIRLVEALRYRCLRDIRQEIGNCQVLVGPNASGKSTFLDVIIFLEDLLKNGLTAAVRARSPNLLNLIWMVQGRRCDLAVELEVPEERWRRLSQNGYERARYEVAVGLDAKGELAILGENFWLKPADVKRPSLQRNLFPCPTQTRHRLVLSEGRHSPKGWKKVVTKKPEAGNDYFMSETTGWNNPFRLGPQRMALANLPEDEDRFPVATWVKRVLMEGIQHLVLNSEAMRRPSPPASPVEFQPDGSNLPWVVRELSKTSPEQFERCVAHIRTALPDVQTIETVERPEDRHLYLQVVYRTTLKAPSRTVSDGTVRLLALTLLAYLDEPGRTYLIEEPENGIHPQAVETVFQSLSSAYGSQILCASHSPVILSLAEPEQVLCFAQDAAGATDVIRGSDHPNLRDWRRGVDLGTLFATGMLG